MAPECYEPNCKVSRKADVYSLGIILLEVLCERPAWKRLVLLAVPFIKNRELAKFTPKHVENNISPECQRACGILIKDCLDFDPDKRPSIDQVVDELELALTLQTQKGDAKGQAISQEV